MSMVRFSDLFPEVANRETRTVILEADERTPTPPPVPPDAYLFDEMYCVERGCDCRRVLVNVYARSTRQHLATISHSFEPPEPGAFIREQTFLDPLLRQTRYSADLMDLFLHTLKVDEDYRQRLIRHYRMVKDATRDPSHPVHGGAGAAPAEPLSKRARRRSIPPPPPPRRGKKWR